MKILILEDCENRIVRFKQRLAAHNITFTDKPKRAIQLLQDEAWDYLMLDHDMGITFDKPGEGTGYEVAKWVSEHPEKAQDTF